MPTQADVRKIALALPGAFEESGHFSFSVANGTKPKHFVWAWRERIDPKKARVPNPKVIAVRVANETEKATLLGADSEKFFTEPHYNGYPAVLVRLDKVTKPELRNLLTEAWRCAAPARLLAPPLRATRTPPARLLAPPSRATRTPPATKPPTRRRSATKRRQVK